MSRVVVTGLGIVSPLGVGTKNVWTRLIGGQSGIQALGKDFEKLPSRIAGVVPTAGEDPTVKGIEQGFWDPHEWLDAASQRRIPLFAQYAIAAAKQALDDADWHPQTETECDYTGVCVGSGIGGFDSMYNNSIAYHDHGYRKVAPLFVPQLLTNMASGHISIRNNLRGPNHSVSTACTTGAHAIGDAAQFIRSGMAQVMVAGSSDATIHPLAVAGFSRAKSLSTAFNDQPTKASRPFDRDRNGFVIGEGAGMLILEELDHAVARSAKIYAEVVGYGLSADANHITAPPADGNGAYRSMKSALKMASIAPSKVDYINAHATSTPIGDSAENNAIKRLMLEGHPDEVKRYSQEINVSSTKGATGHLLGGAGSVEALFSVMALQTGQIPPTLNLDNLQDGFDLNYIPLIHQEQNISVSLTNSFGFGGTNASLVFRKF